METMITLKSVEPVASTDREHVRLRCFGVDGAQTNIDMPTDSFLVLVENLMAFSIQIRSESALPYSPETDNRSREIPGTPALLLATDLDVVWYETGACLLRVTTSAEARLEIALTPKMGEFLIGTREIALRGAPPTH